MPIRNTLQIRMAFVYFKVMNNRRSCSLRDIKITGVTCGSFKTFQRKWFGVLLSGQSPHIRTERSDSHRPPYVAFHNAKGQHEQKVMMIWFNFTSLQASNYPKFVEYKRDTKVEQNHGVVVLQRHIVQLSFFAKTLVTKSEMLKKAMR
jgi:hypothetical protein